ncbi:MAG: dihydropteroate synthase [Planctomycetota bacterium]
MFTVIGELINMTRARVRERVWQRDARYIGEVAKKQAQAGATHIDVNAGGDPSKEVADMEWIVGVVREATELPLSFDSANPDAIRAGLGLCCRPGSLINSITGEVDRVEKILPLVVEHGTGVVALTMDDEGMPEDLEGRVRNADKLAGILREAGVSLDRVFFDPLARPAGTNPGQAPHVFDAIRYIKKRWPEAHIALGMSNISFGLPERNHLNKAHLAMLVGAGCDGAILDPCEPGLMLTLRAALAITGADEYGLEYLAAIREGWA